MMLMLADAESGNLGLWIQGLNFFVMLVLAVIMVVKYLRDDGEKRNVTIDPAAVDKAAFDIHCRENREDINMLHTKLGSSERESRRIAAEGLKDVGHQIMGVAREVSEVKAVNVLQSQSLASVNSKLDRLIERKVSGS
jgi:hypothetical protein